MIDNFSDLVMNIRDKDGKPDEFWPLVSLKTQVVIDALMKSAKQGGAQTKVAMPKF